MSIYQNYMSGLTVLAEQRPGSTGKVAIYIVLLLIVMIAAVLWVTPWIQTSFGLGIVSTLQPQDRNQAITALVPGVIKQWHVKEGERVKKGQAIVTLADLDPALISRLQAEQDAIQRQYEALIIARDAAQLDLTRKQTLLDQGLSSAGERDQAQIKLQEVMSKIADVEAKFNQVKTKFARQSTQTKTAPSDGIITRLYAGSLSTAVNPGDILASFIPDNVQRTVMVDVNGLDGPLIKPGRKVRLQFEGWPVFQFSGWPSVAIGTFGGVVVFVEPVADERGRFRVWIEPDESDIPWPDANRVRLGSRAKAWVLLEEVRLGYEVWRQLNNFPPEVPVEQFGNEK